MVRPTPSRGARIAALAAVATVVSPLAVTATAAPQLQVDQTRKTYIVQLEADPIASYEGGTAGIAATKPAPGQKVKADSANAKKYDAHLRKQHAKALRDAGLSADRKGHDYTVALNGFTAALTASEAAQLAKTSGVVNVWEDEVRYADTVTTPDYLGMSGDAGVWATQFQGEANAGKGIVVGVLDTGIDPDNPSFASIGAAAPDGDFVCENENDPEFQCSDKIVGARYYGADYGNTVAYDFESPRDANGHGSHTAGTSAGNHGVPMTIEGYDLGEGSGMAPAAQIAVYKGLWKQADGNGSGTTSGLVAAINDAVADGVDVINYSISGSRTSVMGPDEVAFLFAADAGVFISTSAGNSGDTVGVSSVAHNSPWTMTVAASSHSRGAEKTVTLGDGSSYEGVGIGDAVGPAPLVLASAVALPGVSATAATQCWLDADNNASNGSTPTLDPAKVAGKIVVCDRGTVARVDKSAAVKLAGGVGMIQTNTSDAQSLNADFHTLPSIHLNATNGAPVKAYAATAAEPTATISAASTEPVVAPVMAGFSSYGPALAGGGDLLKPDITAPGVDVAAAYHEDLETGEPTFNSISGTSMSAPHIAGLGALLKQKYPTWSPAAIKSAMMTTARQTDTSGAPIQWSKGNATPLNFGAGEVVPGKSYNPGLVYDAGWNEWLAYACGIGQLASPCPETPVDPSDLNYPSIAVGDLAGYQEVTRTVTNVTGKKLQYTAKVEAPAGFSVNVVPKRLTIPAGKSAKFKLEITRTTAPMNAYAFGALTWTAKGYTDVRSPIALRPVALAVAKEVDGSGATGSAAITLTPGFTGTLNTDVDGLVASTPVSVTATPDTDAETYFDVAAGTKVLRVASYDSEVDAADIDLTLYYKGAQGWAAVAQSAGGSSEEVITLTNPAAGTYAVVTDLFTNEPSVTFPLHTWQVADGAAGNLTVTPSPVAVTQGTATTLTAAWSGLDASKRYLGRVSYLDGTTVAGSTLVSIAP
ncbi:S8 family serine peptidase [Ornithinimicrobium tianjinense]|uniref:Peptidase inhibitor I9 n=1 Tax=Ornithinimicrobium tianjinense TaxID=1195761 RepID=A0A917BWE1_9MICO|nr:S8 family serine peptidase [Ornithinimicrobium tianjinense]GGF58746.1 hypothetical protein GCM10011366_28240 [Ornithinimicrobium tianjinense]